MGISERISKDRELHEVIAGLEFILGVPRHLFVGTLMQAIRDGVAREHPIKDKCSLHVFLEKYVSGRAIDLHNRRISSVLTCLSAMDQIMCRELLGSFGGTLCAKLAEVVHPEEGEVHYIPLSPRKKGGRPKGSRNKKQSKRRKRRWFRKPPEGVDADMKPSIDLRSAVNVDIVEAIEGTGKPQS